MPWSRILTRVGIALASAVLVVLMLLLGAATIALSIEWDVPREQELPGPSSLFDRDGVPLYRFAAEVERREVPLAAISVHLRDAVVAAEDHRFYEHRGVDPIAVLRAVWNNLRHDTITQGGSTLTQQYVKNAFVGTERTWSRKIREAVISLQLEKDLTKEQILEAYLNRVYFGAGAYGAEAAALTYFDKPASDLTLAEAATLASVIARPSDYNPRADPAGALARRNRVLDQMAEHGFRSPAEVRAAQAAPLGLAEPEPFQPAAPYVIEEIRRQMLAAYGPDLLYGGGLAITATLDVDRQFELEHRMLQHLPADPAVEPAAVAVDPATGDVLAAWSGRDFNASQVDLALSQDYGRPTGSAFKVFALVTALEEGYDLEDTFPAPATERIGDWTPSGGGCGGRCTLLEATVRSVNTAYANIGNAVGVADFTDMARRLGVRSTLRDHDLTQVLGTASVTPLDMASAFGTLANDGIACPARVVLRVTDHEGNPLPPPDPRQPTQPERTRWQARILGQGWDVDLREDLGRCYRAVAPGVARRANVALEQVVQRGTGQAADIGRPQAGKTGTTSDHTQAWFVGYTPDLSLAVMVSHRDGDVPLHDLPGCSGPCFGGEAAAPIWADLAEGLLAGVPPRPFPAPQDDERHGPMRGTAAPATEPTPSATPTPTATATPTPTASATPSRPAPPEPTLAPTATPTGPTGTPPAPDGGLLDRLFGPDDS